MKKIESIRIVGKLSEANTNVLGQDVRIIAMCKDGEEVDLSGPTGNLVINCPIDDIVTADIRFVVNGVDIEGIAPKVITINDDGQLAGVILEEGDSNEN